MTACEHNTSVVLHKWGNVSLSLCTWECGSRLISVKDMNSGITKTVTVEAFAAQQTALEAWKQALQSLTPGGSEFTEPHECANYLRTRDAERWELLKKMKIERDAKAAALEAS